MVIDVIFAVSNNNNNNNNNNDNVSINSVAVCLQ